MPAQHITLEGELVTSRSHDSKGSPAAGSYHQQGHIRGSTSTSISSSIYGSQASVVPLDQEMHRSSRSSGSLHAPSLQPQSSQAPTSCQPLTYNPAAPATPEAIKHREMTPPPEDGAENPLVSAVIADQVPVYDTHYQYSCSGFSGLHPSALSQQQAQVQSPHAQNFENQFAEPSTSATGPPPAYQAQAPGETFNGSPGIHIPSFPTASSYPSSYNPVIPPPGGFAQFDYNAGLRNNKPLMMDYSIHSQVYRPTEAEAAVKTKPIKPPSGKLEARARTVETGLNGLLKKLEKKIG